MEPSSQRLVQPPLLEFLYLGGNFITSILLELANLPSLSYLVLCDNKMQSVPPQLAQRAQERGVSNNSGCHWIFCDPSFLGQLALFNSVPSTAQTMWLHEGFGCALEMGFNYSNSCDNSSGCQEKQQKALQDLCTITITSSGSNCKSSPALSAAFLGIVWIFLTGGVLLSFFFLIFTIHFRKNRIVKMSSPNLNIMTLLGSALTYSSAYLFGIEKQNPLTRQSMEMLVQIIKDFQLLVMVAVLVLADIILLLTWIFLDPVQCLQSLNADLKVTEKGLTCTVNQGYFCTSLYSDLWLILFLGFKGILLMYGAYLAGLTDDVSCPPVNQSLTLIIGITTIFLSTGIMLVVIRFFHLWHNLVFGFISGGILVCTATINCLIFIPQQVRQWKAFENQKDDISNMAKYFTSSSKHFHSTMYSDEEIYQLLGEKNSMMQLLVEKDTAIASLQEQVNSAKEKLMRLVAMKENDNAADCPFPSTAHLLQGHSVTSCSPTTAESPSRDPSSSGQELKSWQYPKLSHSQCDPGSISTKSCISYLECRSQWNVPPEIASRYRLLNRSENIADHSSAKDDQGQWLSQYTTTLSMNTLQEPLGQSSPKFSSLSRETKQSLPLLLTKKQLPGIGYMNGGKLQESFQELDMNHITVMQASPKGYEQSPDCGKYMVWQPQEIQEDNFTKLHPFKTRQEETVSIPQFGSLAPETWCSVNKAARRTQSSGPGLTELPWAAASDSKDGRSLHQQPSVSLSVLKKMLHYKAETWSECSSNEGHGWLLDKHQVENCGSTLYPTSPKDLHHNQSVLKHTRLDSGLVCPDSGSSSSGSLIHCHHRQYCEVCHHTLSSSSDSSVTDTDLEPGMALDYCAKLYGKPQPIVNFNEDLEPTYV
ncbi:probable G-protein coupled receptor 156 isoform X3 [Hemicordylus capensis]|uniref:probable G-protein coupled receptor 156 isoform X3 n=1 Tax=Hemicordylus capensis TaxID=884348 RepID=UPI00230490A7|nr:probable G-protein coupled receptor 156 isoform X3 [Hemicordylus capensis]